MTGASLPAVTLRRRPFFQLLRLFCGRVIHGASESGDGELQLSTGLVLTILALPGALYSVFLLDKYSTLLLWMRHQHRLDPVTATLPDEYFFIVLSMAISGIVAVWRWDSIFPDRRDYANLVPLPLRSRDIFLANAAAVAAVALVLAVDINFVSAPLFPLVVVGSVGESDFLPRFMAVHALVVAAASIFSFLLMLSIAGIFMLLLPVVLFRRVSTTLRALLVSSLLALLVASFTVPGMLRELPASWVKFLPSVWFLGLSQLLRGNAGSPLASLGLLVLAAFPVVLSVLLVCYAGSYRRHFTASMELQHGFTGRGGAIFRVLDRTILRSPFQRATYRFAMKTLFRSEQHSLLLGAFFGLGVVLSSAFLLLAGGAERTTLQSPPWEMFAIPLTMVYCLALALRISFDVPADRQANWVFRLLVPGNTRECVPLGRRIMLTFLAPVPMVAFAVFGSLWGWRAGLMQVSVGLVWAVLLADLLLLKFRKILFTCSYPQFRHGAIVLLQLYVLGFFLVVIGSAELEAWALVEAGGLVPLVAMLLIAAGASWWLCRSEAADEPTLVFEEPPPRSVESLDLSRGQ